MSAFGDAAAVSGAAGDLRRAAADLGHAREIIERAKPVAWEGAAADAYVAAAKSRVAAAQKLQETLSSASGTLTRYAAAQVEAASDYETARADTDTASRAVRANVLDLVSAMNVVHSRMAELGAVGRLQRAATIAAAELRASLGEDGDARPWWDPFGWFNDAEDPDQQVSDDILDDDSFDSDDVAQGGIGDCFMLSSVLSLLNSDVGDDFVRQNIRWDASANGYWVTLYENGQPTEVFVQYVFDNGARQRDWEFLFLHGDKPSIAALYEAAMRQEYGYGFLDGGVPADAMEIITGTPVDVIENADYSGLSDTQVEQLGETLDAGGQVVISSPRTGDHQITVTAPDGSTREIDVVNTHSYAVTRVESDGSVWMRNPWGPGNSADGGGEFRVSAEDVADLFWRATSTNVTQ